MILMRIDIPDRCIRQSVHPISRKLDLLIVVVIHNRIIGCGGMLQRIRSQPVLVSAPLLLGNGLFPGAQMPFSNISCIISSRVKIIGHRLMLPSQHSGITVGSDRRRVFSCLQDASCRAAYRLRGKRFADIGSFLRHFIKIGSESARVSRSASGIPPLLIRKKNDYIHFHSPLI